MPLDASEEKRAEQTGQGQAEVEAWEEWPPWLVEEEEDALSILVEARAALVQAGESLSMSLWQWGVEGRTPEQQEVEASSPEQVALAAWWPPASPPAPAHPWSSEAPPSTQK